MRGRTASHASSSLSDGRLENDSVVGFDHPVSQKFHEGRDKPFDVLRHVDKLDAQRHVLRGIYSSVLAVNPMVVAKTCYGSQQCCACDAFPEKEREDFSAQKVAL